jgi:DNA-binding CsgD family transcriptional regulator
MGGVIKGLAKRHSSFRELSGQRPELMTAAIGFACCLVPSQSKTITTLAGIYPLDLSLVLRLLIAAAAAAVVFFILKRKPASQIGGKTRGVVLIALFFSLCLLAKYGVYLFGIDLPVVEMAGKLLEEAAGILLILLWAERLLPYGMKRCLFVLGSASVMAAMLQILISFFQQIPAMLFMSLLPLASGCLYGLFRTSKALRLLQDPEAGRGEGSRAEGSDEDHAVFALRRSPTILYLIICCFLVISGYITNFSLETQQSMASSPIAQIGLASGTLIGGVLILLMLDYLGDRLFVAVCSLIMFALLAIAFYLITFVQGPWISIFLLLNTIILTLVSMLLWLIPFLFSRRISAIAQLAFGYTIYFIVHTCTAVFMVAGTIFMLPIYEVITGGVLVVLLACCLYFLFSLINFNKNDPDKQSAAAPDNALTTSKPLQDALAEIGTEFKLTQQEQRILLLLAKGRNVKYISESLVVTSNTVKSHMRNIYAKLGVHTQQELISFVDSFDRKHPEAEETRALPGHRSERM